MSEEYVSLVQAAAYLGISRVKLAHLVKDGTILYVTSPLDRRVKLFKRHDLDQLKQAPRATAAYDKRAS